MSPSSSLSEIVQSFSCLKVMVVGDLVLDEYLYGKTRRISREAPVPIVDLESEELRPGGAANTAANFASMGAKVAVVGLVGADTAGDKLAKLLKSMGIKVDGIFKTKNRPTTSKTRVMAGDLHTTKQQLLRIDKGERSELTQSRADNVAKRIAEQFKKFDAIAFSDYGFGILADPILHALRKAAKQIPVVADSRFDLMKLTGLTAVTPNEPETGHALGVRIDGEDAGEDTIEKAGASLVRRLKCRHALITRGNRGMALFTGSRKPVIMPIAQDHEAVDVTGAGDTVVAAFTLGLASGAEPADAAQIANYAAGLAVSKIGAVAVTAEEIIRSFA